MAGVLHVVRKDVRRMRWLLLLWVAILAARVAFVIVSNRIATEPVPPALALLQLGGIVGMLETLMLALLVARLVHEEPLVGLNAFRLTRAYSRGSLLAAKLTLAFAALVLLPVAADLLTMSLFNAGAGAQLRASSAFLSTYVIWTLPLLVAAVLTPSLGVFTIAIVGVVAASSLAVSILIGVMAFAVDDVETYMPTATPDPTPAMVGYVVFVAAALSVIVYQYRHRRWRVAAGLAAVGLVATFVVPAIWPWPFARPTPIEPGAWTADRAATMAVVDRSVPMEVSEFQAFGRQGMPRRYIHAPVRLTGMPADAFTRNVGVRGTLTFADGTAVQSRQSRSFFRQHQLSVGGTLRACRCACSATSRCSPGSTSRATSRGPRC